MDSRQSPGPSARGKKGAKSLGLAGDMGTALFCMDTVPLLCLLGHGLAASPLFSQERGAQPLPDIAYPVRVTFFLFYSGTYPVLFCLISRCRHQVRCFHIMMRAWDRNVYWLFTHQEVIPCLFLKEFERFTSIIQNSAITGRAKQKLCKQSDRYLVPSRF